MDESWTDDSQPELIFQLHGDKDTKVEPSRCPPFALYLEGASWYWNVRWDTRVISTSLGGEGERRVWKAPYEKGKWVDWVIHARWSHQDDGVGFIRIWKDGVAIVEDTGPNLFNDAAGMKGPQFGIYKWPWLNGPSDVDERVVYFDEIYVGDHTSSFEAVSPPKD